PAAVVIRLRLPEAGPGLRRPFYLPGAALCLRRRDSRHTLRLAPAALAGLASSLDASGGCGPARAGRLLLVRVSQPEARRIGRRAGHHHGTATFARGPA